MTDNNRNLYYLDELPDYKVADDYCDVNGWDVKDNDNRTIGKVDNLLVSKKDERVVYLDVEVDKSLIEDGFNTFQVPASDGVHGFVNKDGSDHLIVPIGMVILDEDKKCVLTNEIDYNTFTKAGRFKKGEPIDRNYEFKLFKHYVRVDSLDEATWDDKFYSRKEFDNNIRRRNSQ